MTVKNSNISTHPHLAKKDFNLSEKINVYVVLDNLRSGLNIGSIFRTCDAFLVKKIFICGNSAIPPHKEILKTALGATETVAWEYNKSAFEICEALKLNGVQILAVEQSESSISLQNFNLDDTKDFALVLGNEVDGVSPDILGLCHYHLEIPQFGSKHSLNVSVAHGIVLWHIASKLIIES